MDSFDWKNPDYVAVFRERQDRLLKLRADPQLLALCKKYYKDHPAQFINDWGCTTDPRNIEKKRPALIPFILFPKQVEWIDWVMDRWANSEPGISDKSRDSGLSWLSISLACTLCLFHDNLIVGF